METYFESAEGLKISLDRVLKEIKKHGGSLADLMTFKAEVKPDKNEMYDAQAVLLWLGY